MDTKQQLETLKKVLYKENTVATKVKDNDGDNNSVYETETSVGKVKFVIPFSEQTDGNGDQKLFDQYMPAKLLNRWITID